MVDDETLKNLALAFLLLILLALLTVGVGEAGNNNLYNPTPTITRRPWATVTPTPSPWPRTLPCEDDKEHPIMEEWTRHWATWVELYREKGYHEVLLEIALAVIMHESRGNPSAFSVYGAVGVMQVLPGEVMPGNPPRRRLQQSWFNIWFGLDLLESYEWEAFIYNRQMERWYRKHKYIGIPGARELKWWYTEDGRTTLAMYQCGPAGFERGSCGRYGGEIYADDVLECWVPWVQEILGIEVDLHQETKHARFLSRKHTRR